MRPLAPPFHGRRAPLLATILLGLCLGGCGSGSDVDRPVVVGTYPPSEALLENVVDEFRVYYDEPVEILNPSSARGYDERGQISVVVFETEDPRALGVRPSDGTYLQAGEFRLHLEPGLEVNRDGHYRLEDVWITFTFGAGSNAFVASRGRGAVVELDRDDFTQTSVTPTPGGRAPVGVVSNQVGDDVRVWVQLENGAGTGQSLAWYRPGDAAMTPVSLTEAGADLVTDRRAVGLDRGGRHVLVAWRDTALEQVRVAKVDTATGLEVATCVLSPAAGAATRPVGLQVGYRNQSVFVACACAVGDRICSVDLETFDEEDIGADDGVDGLLLPVGAGALAIWGAVVFSANLPQATASLTATRPSTGTLLGESPSSIPGTPEDLIVTPDGRWIVEGLSAYDGDEALALRLRTAILDPFAFAVSTETSGGGAAATAVRRLARCRATARFLALFDNDALATFQWDGVAIVQDDLDDVLEGVQAADLSTVAPDPLDAAFTAGLIPP